jgi:hypothetical protein
MNIVTRIFFLPIMATAFAGMAGCTVGDESEKGDDADLVLQNGSVYTVDADACMVFGPRCPILSQCRLAAWEHWVHLSLLNRR